jgi:misacylated tRNA(Ala) deacylase
MLFVDQPYLQDCMAEVIEVNDRGGIILDQTVFYATGGGQPGDSGVMVLASDEEIPIATTVYGPDRAQIIHVPANPAPRPLAGERVRLKLDWARRHAHMRIHTGLHLLSAVLDYPVTGGSIGAGKGRLDFDIPEAGLDKEEIAAKLNELIAADLPVSFRWISDEELDAQPELVKTMSVKPPRGAGRVRLVSIEGCDLQPCGGTHVAKTGEIGRLAVPKIEKKGGKNRRVRIAFAQ